MLFRNRPMSMPDSPQESSSPSRRDFLKTGALSAVAFGAGGLAGRANGQPRTDVDRIGETFKE